MIDYTATITRLIEKLPEADAAEAREAMKQAAGDAKALQALHASLSRKVAGGGWQTKQQHAAHTR